MDKLEDEIGVPFSITRHAALAAALSPNRICLFEGGGGTVIVFSTSVKARVASEEANGSGPAGPLARDPRAAMVLPESARVPGLGEDARLRVSATGGAIEIVQHGVFERVLISQRGLGSAARARAALLAIGRAVVARIP